MTPGSWCLKAKAETFFACALVTGKVGRFTVDLRRDARTVRVGVLPWRAIGTTLDSIVNKIPNTSKSDGRTTNERIAVLICVVEDSSVHLGRLGDLSSKISVLALL